MLYKLRTIVKFKGKKRKIQEVMGVTIPNEDSVFFKECYFSVVKSGTCIILASGTNYIPTKEEIQNYEFAECRV